MVKKTRILALTLGFSLMLSQAAYADIAPLNVDGSSAQAGTTVVNTTTDSTTYIDATGGSSASYYSAATEVGSTGGPGTGSSGSGTSETGNYTANNDYQGYPGDPGPGAGGTTAEESSEIVDAEPVVTTENALYIDLNSAEIPTVTAEAAALYDATHKVFLYEKNADEKLPPASITKLLTALLVIENANMDDMVTFSSTATTNLESGAITLNLTAGDTVSVKDCLYGMLLRSACDVANGLAEHVGGSIENFCSMMNARAASLGCTNTFFENPSGLNGDNQRTTAHDYALIAAEAFKNETLCEIDSTLTYTFPATKNAAARTVNHGDKMLNPANAEYYEGIVGGKTGFTTPAGNTLVTCVEKDGARLIVVTLKGTSAANNYSDTKALLDYGYEVLANATIAEVETTIQSPTSGENGFVTDGTYTYYYNANGTKFTGWYEDSAGNWYYFDPDNNGAMVVKDWVQDKTSDGNIVWFYCGSDGAIVKNAIIDGQYCVGSDGAMVVNSWVQNGSDLLYFGSDGKMVKNAIINNTYYVDENGVRVVNGWIQSSNGWFYCGSDGVIARNETVDGRYYVDSNGIWDNIDRGA